MGYNEKSLKVIDSVLEEDSIDYDIKNEGKNKGA